MTYEYRVTWRREGLRQKSRFYQTKAAAQAWTDRLKVQAGDREDWPCLYSASGRCTSHVDYGEDCGVCDGSLPAVVMVRLERRAVAAWEET